MQSVIWQTEITGTPAPRRGKVRDIYDLGDELLIVACDRISAYDHILQPGIPQKGKILHQLTNFWLEHFRDLVPNHLITDDVDEFPEPFRGDPSLAGRAARVRKAAVVPFECVVRGYLAGSGFREYVADRTVCGIPLAAGLVRASPLDEPIFTPATKAETGHDENVDFATMAGAIGQELAEKLRDLSLEIYRRGAAHAAGADLILADTKFEFGIVDGEVLLIDEVLTPDSSRYWEKSEWQPGTEPVSVDKQYVRNWLDGTGWDHESPPPRLSDGVIVETRRKYLEAFRRLTGSEPVL